MKKIFAIITMGLLILLLCSCGTPESGEPDLQAQMLSLSTRLSEDGLIVEIDTQVLDDFSKSLTTTRFRLRGVSSRYREEVFAGVTSRVCDLTSSGLTFHVSFSDSVTDVPSEGEYIEVTGTISDWANWALGSASFNVHDAEIVERGASVRERVEEYGEEQ